MSARNNRRFHLQYFLKLELKGVPSFRNMSARNNRRFHLQYFLKLKLKGVPNFATGVLETTGDFIYNIF